MVIAGIVLDNPGSYLLMAAFVVVHIASLGDETLLDRWCLSSYSVKHRNQWYRIISSGFVHSGWVHLALNCLGIWYFGTLVEDLVGPILMVLFFILSVIGGSFYSMRLRRFDHDYLAVGASGGVMGLMMMSVMWVPTVKLGLFILPVMLPGWLFAVLINWASMVFSLTDDKQRISHEGHLGGAFWGGLIGAMVMMLVFNILGDVAMDKWEEGITLEHSFVSILGPIGFSVKNHELLLRWVGMRYNFDYSMSWVLLWAGILPVGIFWLLQEIRPSIFKRKWWRK
ncbi:MAG: rhomboid family intramembrane serine protease [Bacteroidota bacterium]|jgi:membrane associated rhomboid family serine protease